MTSQNSSDSTIKDTGMRAFQAWQTGEQTGDYSDFLALLASPDAFERFSHPVSPRGVHDGEAGAEALKALIAERMDRPNHLTFTNVLLLEGEDGQIGFFFDSEGTIQNGAFSYRGYNCIVFTVRSGRIAGFREYLGDVEPAWFGGGSEL